MKWTFKVSAGATAILIGGVLCAGLTGAAQAGAATSAPGCALVPGTPLPKGVTITATLNKAKVARGSNFTGRYTVTNRGSSPFTFQAGAPETSSILSSLATRNVAGTYRGLVASGAADAVVRPGKSVSDTFLGGTQACVSGSTAPGHYVVVVGVSGTGVAHHHFFSSPVPIQVTP